MSGDAEKLKEAAALWHRAGWRDTVVSPDEMICHGCHTAPWCRYEIQSCAMEKGVDNCGQCDAYPCGRVARMFERTAAYAETCREKCSKEEYECLRKAFFSKKENLTRAATSSQEA